VAARSRRQVGTGAGRAVLSPASRDALLERLRAATPPVIARIERDRVLLDPRTLLPDQMDTAVAALRSSIDG